MSEELKQKGLTESGIKIGKYEYFNIGNTTISELAKYKIIPQKNYGEYSKKRPDGVFVDRTNKNDPRVIGVIEYKDGKRFRGDKEVREATKQCNNYAQVLGAIFGVATDTNVSYWINPKGSNKNFEYIDDFGCIRSYDTIRNEEKQNISENFLLQQTSETNIERLDDDTKYTLKLIERIISANLGREKSELQDTKNVDPTGLAKSVWQDIYVATGKEPEKCLYNVVEIFIFKFLSDLGILKNRYSFGYLVEMINEGEVDEEVLKHYAITIRPEIKNLFPPSPDDNTTIINGTIFVNEKGEPVIENASLFRRSIDKYNKFGELTHVEKDFKTKLYETFLKRDSGVKGMGQFFTPRKVVRAMVEMAKVENLSIGAKVCDPFCGVGGFPLEVIAARKNKDFEVVGDEVSSKIEYHGYDKGSSEKDSERTIILAKANMLIYLADLIKDHPSLTTKFAALFNDTFKLKKGTLGTLAIASTDEKDLFDLILTNPPYVTSGSRIIKEEIEKHGAISDFYKINAMGVEGLALEWIIRKLKKGGKAFVVVPDGIFNRLNDKKLRQFILDNCYLNAVISLPINTFFTTPQKTHILALTKKEKQSDRQKIGVFTYLVTDIGETLDVYRFNTGKSDLEEAKNQFRMFDGNESYFVSHSERCKIQPIEKFIEEIESSWTIDRWWTKEEKINLGVTEEEEILSTNELEIKLKKIGQITDKFKIPVQSETTYKSISLKGISSIERGNSEYTQTFIENHKGDYPVYSSKTTGGGVMGYIDTYDHSVECLTYTTNGVKAGTLFYRLAHNFSMNGDCASIVLLSDYSDSIDYKFLYYTLRNKFKEYGFSWENKATPTRVYDIMVDIPVDSKGNFDLAVQQEIAKKYEQIEHIKHLLSDELEYLVNVQVAI